MRILSLDTATRATAVALCESDGHELEARDDPAPGDRPRHNTRLMALIIELLERADMGWESIERIGVGIGPGSFTGLRIGISTARALAGTREIPLVGVCTLRSLAYGGFAAAPEVPPAEGGAEDQQDVIAVLDARRGEVFAAGWHGDASGLPFLAPAALAPQRLAELVAARGSHPLAVGEGALAFGADLERAGAVIPREGSLLHRVTAINHCRLAANLRPQTPDQVHPAYLRLADAEIARRSIGSR